MNKVKIFNDISGVMNSKPYSEKAINLYQDFVNNNNIEVVWVNMNKDLSTVVLTYIERKTFK